jgi:DNA-binding NarL/FixJ family response regulator
LVMSVLEELANPQEALEAGADRILSKITSSDRVVATIRNLKAAQSSASYPSA